ncbi:MAG: hypothetical protein J1E82_02595 [Muribaculaceae bacterium]|nr:hypothetical protein [Muribaculaceae bacterium]
MKKIYTPLALALTAAFFTQTADAQITNVDQLYGTYNAVYLWGFNDNNGNPIGAPDFLITPEIKAGDTDKEILLTGLFPTHGDEFAMNANNPIKGTVDIATQTITIAANQSLGEDEFGKNTLYISAFNQNTQQWYDADSVTAQINEYGNIVFPTDYVLGCESTDGTQSAFWYVFFSLTLQPYSGEGYLHDASFYNGTYNTSFEWYSEDINGNPLATPNDIIEPTISAAGNNSYTLEISGLFPYLQNNKLSLQATVLPSGDIRIDNFQLWDFGGTAFQFMIFDENFNLPDYVIGYLDQNGNIEFSENSMLGMGIYTGMSYTFSGFYGYIGLVLSRDEAGVESIGSDLNAPVNFFDLQGKVVRNPAPGQLLIKKQGKNVSKVIIK